MRNKRFSLDNGPSDTNDQCGEAIQQFLGIGTHLGQEKGSEEGTINPASSASQTIKPDISLDSLKSPTLTAELMIEISSIVEKVTLFTI